MRTVVRRRVSLLGYSDISIFSACITNEFETDPLRNLACTICLELVCEDSLPLYARTFVLRYILGPASMMLHHLETRIALSEKILRLLQEDSYEDIEFRSLVQRIAKKIGIRKPSSDLERLKLYHYLENVIIDPMQHCRCEKIAAYMTKDQWKTALDHDLAFYLYSTEYKPQILLFLEALKVMAIDFSTFVPSQVQKAIFGEPDLVDAALIHLHRVQKQLCSTVAQYRNTTSEPETAQRDRTATHVLDMACELNMGHWDSSSSIQTLLRQASVEVCRALDVPCSQPIEERVNQLQQLSRQLLEISAVAPMQFIHKIMWTTAVCLRACKDLEESRAPIQIQVSYQDFQLMWFTTPFVN
ncbi:hypothetical protein BGX34_008867 [Mortierella sp. NVP85]|nr:hypothetical protein BGX34_008867 [Mortierella sp. NVP85]